MMIRTVLTGFVVCLISAFVSAFVSASENQDAQFEEFILYVEKLTQNPLVIQAVEDQNQQLLSMEQIEERDEEWQSTKELTPLKRELQESPVGLLLQQEVRKNKKSVSEIFVTDNQGANVAAFPATSDYWQGDEEKWSAAFNKGNGKRFIGPIQYDESSNTMSAQISSPIIKDEKTIGIIIVGIKMQSIVKKMIK